MDAAFYFTAFSLGIGVGWLIGPFIDHLLFRRGDV